MNRIHSAIKFATVAHGKQTRKGTALPYIIHPLEVLTILTEMNMPDDVRIAGILHDVVEDTEVGIDEIRANFGDVVADIVGGHSEDKSKSWQERKEADMHAVEIGDKALKAVVLADKISNMRSMTADYEIIGEELWKRFNAGKDKQAWYFNRLIEVFDNAIDFEERVPYVEEMRSMYKVLFG